MIPDGDIATRRFQKAFDVVAVSSVFGIESIQNSFKKDTRGLWFF